LKVFMSESCPDLLLFNACHDLTSAADITYFAVNWF